MRYLSGPTHGVQCSGIRFSSWNLPFCVWDSWIFFLAAVKYVKYIYIYMCVGSHRALFLEKNAHFHYQGGFWHADKNQWTIDSKHHTKCAWKLCFSSFHPHIFLVSFLDQSISVVQKSGGTSFVQLCFTRKNADGRMMVGFSQLRKIPERSWGKISGEWSIFHLEASKSWWSCW